MGRKLIGIDLDRTTLNDAGKFLKEHGKLFKKCNKLGMLLP
ncbi:hypothetical protein ABU186_01315 [Weissella paramesenteroides]